MEGRRIGSIIFDSLNRNPNKTQSLNPLSDGIAKLNYIYFHSVLSATSFLAPSVFDTSQCLILLLLLRIEDAANVPISVIP